MGPDFITSLKMRPTSLYGSRWGVVVYNEEICIPSQILRTRLMWLPKDTHDSSSYILQKLLLNQEG